MKYIKNFEDFVNENINPINEKMIPKRVVKLLRKDGWDYLKSLPKDIIKIIEPKIEDMISKKRDIDQDFNRNEKSPWVHLDWWQGLQKGDDVILWAEHPTFTKYVYLIVGNIKGQIAIKDLEQPLGTNLAQRYAEDPNWPINMGYNITLY